jgi:hypothetical protein
MRPGRERLHQDLVALCHQGLDVPGFFGRAQQVLGRFVGFDGCCWLTFDPATVLPTGHIPYRSIPPEQVPRAVENEYAEEDVNKFAVLARDARHVGVLSQATGGRRDRSIRYRVVLVPNGWLPPWTPSGCSARCPSGPPCTWTLATTISRAGRS